MIFIISYMDNEYLILSPWINGIEENFLFPGILAFLIEWIYLFEGKTKRIHAINLYTIP
jgi:hypothetical protein